MQANWSLILNVLLLIGVIIAIGRLMKARRQSLSPVNYQPSLGQTETKPAFDEIIAVRKINNDSSSELLAKDEGTIDRIVPKTAAREGKAPAKEQGSVAQNESAKSLMMFLLAKEKRQLAGYELLQTVLAAGLRFGEGSLFHRHQHANGQGPVICSLAAATPTGVFDLQNMGAFSVRGLCLFMQTSGNPTIDAERFSIMYETAKQLREGLDTHLLDDKKQPWSDESVAHYRRMLNLRENHELPAILA